jgi:hypothetical protein
LNSSSAPYWRVSSAFSSAFAAIPLGFDVFEHDPLRLVLEVAWAGSSSASAKRRRREVQIGDVVVDAELFAGLFR